MTLDVVSERKVEGHYRHLQGDMGEAERTLSSGSPPGEAHVAGVAHPARGCTLSPPLLPSAGQFLTFKPGNSRHTYVEDGAPGLVASVTVEGVHVSLSHGQRSM